MGNRIFAINQYITSNGNIPGEYDSGTSFEITSLTAVRFLFNDAPNGTTLTVKVKVAGQSTFTTLGSVSYNENKVFDLKYYDYMQLSISGYTSRCQLIGAGFRVSGGTSISVYDSFAAFPDAVGSGNFAWDNATNTLYFDDTVSQTWEAASAGTVTLTSNRVAYGSSTNTLTGESDFTYNESTNTLSVENITSSGTIISSNITGNNTGDVTTVDTNSIDLSLSGQQLQADLKISSGSLSNTRLPILLDPQADGILASVSTYKYDTAFYVNDLAGNDSFDGSFTRPFQTMTAAMNAISDATISKRYAVFFQGDFSLEPFTLKPFVILVGIQPSISRLGTVTYTAPVGTSLVGILNATVSTLTSNTTLSAQHSFRTHNCEINTANLTGNGTGLDQYVFTSTNFNIAINFSGGFTKISGASLVAKPSITDTLLGSVNQVVIYGGQVVSSPVNLTGNALLQLIGCDFTSNITSSTVGLNIPQLITDVKSYPQGIVSGTVQIVPTGDLRGAAYTPTDAYFTASVTNTFEAVEELAKHQYNVETVTLSPTDITNKSVALAKPPFTPLKTRVTVIGGIEQSYGVDFVVVGNEVDWNGFGLENLLESGDKIVVIYF